MRQRLREVGADTGVETFAPRMRKTARQAPHRAPSHNIACERVASRQALLWVPELIVKVVQT